MKCMCQLLLVAFLVTGFSITYSFASDRYMALSGSDFGSCIKKKSPCRTLRYAMKQMQGGETLFIDDGTYSGEENSIWQFQVPPSGSPKSYTTIRAKNIPGLHGIPENKPLRVHFTGKAIFESEGPGDLRSHPPRYVKFWGIKWDGIDTFTGWDHIYFKQVSSEGVKDGNNAAIGISGRNNLLEDVVAHGKGRYKILFYEVSREKQATGPGNNLCRRCVVRHDWANRDEPNPLPIAGIVAYYSRDAAFLNSVVIDSDAPAQWQESPTELAGAFAQVVDDGRAALTIKGCLALNTAMAVVANRNGSSGHVIQDLVGIRVAGGMVLNGATDVERVSLIDVGSSKYSYRGPQQKSKLQGGNVGVLNWSGLPVKIRNSVFSTIDGVGVNGASIKTDYLDLYNIRGKQFSGAKPTRELFSFDPLKNGLLYPVTVQAGSRLFTSGSNGGQIGARLMHRLGVDGTFKGASGWDAELSGSPLWPWPLEEWIQAELRTSRSALNPLRGFCAKGQTLTKYVWESLGNTLPGNMYSQGASSLATSRQPPKQ